MSVTQNITTIKLSPYPQSYMYYQPFLPSCPQSYHHVVPCSLSYHLVPSSTIKLSLVPFPTILSPVLPSSCPLSPFLPSCPQSYHHTPTIKLSPCPQSLLSFWCGVVFIFISPHLILQLTDTSTVRQMQMKVNLQVSYSCSVQQTSI